MNFHEIANIFPLLQGEEFEKFSQSIDSNGLIEAIWLHPDGSIIDGRNRYRACQKVGVEPRFRTWDGVGSLADFVTSLNMDRRHLTSGQRAAAAVEIEPFYAAEAKERMRAGAEATNTGKEKIPYPESDQGQSRDRAAAATGTNPRYVSDMKRIKQDDPVIFEQVKAGDISISEAKKEVLGPKDKTKGEDSEPEDEDEDLPPLVYDGVSFAYCKYCYVTHDRWDLSGDHDPDAWECRNCGHFTADQYMDIVDGPEDKEDDEEGEPKDNEMIIDTEAKTSHAVHFSSTTPEWYTPQHVIDRVIQTFGQIDLDPCSNGGDNPNVPATAHYSKQDDGLSKSWAGRTYMNPPYGNELSLWVKKILQEFSSGRIPEAIILTPARTDTQWFQSLRQFPKCFVTGRLKFGGGAKNSAPFPSMLVYLGPNIDAFYNAFSDIGDIYELKEEYIEAQ